MKKSRFSEEQICLRAAPGRRRDAGGGRVPQRRGIGGDLLRVKEEVCQSWRERAAPAQECQRYSRGALMGQSARENVKIQQQPATAGAH